MYYTPEIKARKHKVVLLIQALLDAGMKIESLAKALKNTKWNIQSWLKGKTTPDLSRYEYVILDLASRSLPQGNYEKIMGTSHLPKPKRPITIKKDEPQKEAYGSFGCDSTTGTLWMGSKVIGMVKDPSLGKVLMGALNEMADLQQAMKKLNF